MMPRQPTGLKLGDKYDIYQDIDLKKITGVDLSNSPRLREEIAQAFIDEIVARTEDGKNIFGNGLKGPYSKSYSESEEFKDADKSRNDINMTLSGDMLTAIDILQNNGNSLRIGFNDDTDQKKAANHNNGVTVPKRQFFGITEKDMRNIVNTEFKSEIEAVKRGQDDTRLTAADILGATTTQPEQVFNEIFGGVFLGDS